MGKSLPYPKDFARIITYNKINNQIRPASKARPVSSRKDQPAKPSGNGLQLRLKTKTMQVGNSNSTVAAAEQQRVPLVEVVADCVKRWFQDSLKEAKAGDAAMQVLVGQMYYNGYGVPKDAQKGGVWINRASKIRASAWKVGDKHPGYNASDSDSEDAKGEDK